MADKRRYTVTVPDHVADAVESRAKPLGATPTEYAADILRWWFGQGCPPVTHDETALLSAAVLKRMKPMPSDLNIWSLSPKDVYVITDDSMVTRLLSQLELPNLFAHAAEHDSLRMCIVFDNHPTHWLQFDFFKGSTAPDGNGLVFNAYPKSSTSREDMLDKMQQAAKEMESVKPPTFSQIPILEKKDTGQQAPQKQHASP